MQPKLSIIVPVYNVAPYVAGCVKSIMDQDYENLEVLFVDDCSPDNSMEIIKQTIAENNTNHIEWKFLNHEYNRGLSAARNTGIAASSGEYIMFVDSDDALTPRATNVMMAQILINPDLDFVVGNRDIIWTPTGEIKHQPWTRRKNCHLMLNLEDYVNYSLQDQAYNKLIKKSFLIKNNLFFAEGLLYEDSLWMSQVKCCMPKILYIPDVTYVYCLRPESIMTTYKEKHLTSQIGCAISSYKFAKNFKGITKWFALLSAYSFRKSALLNCLANTRHGIRNYFKLYRLFKRHLPLNKDYDLILPKLTKAQKLRFYLNRIYWPIGASVEIWFIAHITRTLKKKGNFQYNAEKLTLPKDFYKNLF